MNLLLDTHIWLWSLLDPDRLSDRTRNELTDPANTLALSPVSVWEALVLAEKGRVLLHPDPWSWIRTALTVKPMREADGSLLQCPDIPGQRSPAPDRLPGSRRSS